MRAFLTFVAANTPVNESSGLAARSLADALFTTQFVVTHSWPTKKSHNQVEWAQPMTTAIISKQRQHLSTSVLLK